MVEFRGPLQNHMILGDAQLLSQLTWAIVVPVLGALMYLVSPETPFSRDIHTVRDITYRSGRILRMLLRSVYSFTGTD